MFQQTLGVANRSLFSLILTLDMLFLSKSKIMLLLELLTIYTVMSYHNIYSVAKVTPSSWDGLKCSMIIDNTIVRRS